MKKLFLMMVASTLMTGAFADTLYWLVDQEPKDGIEFGYARLGVAEGGTKVEDVYLCTLAAADGLKTDLGVADLGAYGKSDYSFYVELYDSAAKSVGITGLYAYGELLEAGYIAPGGIGTGGDKNWTVTTFNSVPEPTSALLLLMGLAGLALRRKERNANA